MRHAFGIFNGALTEDEIRELDALMRGERPLRKQPLSWKQRALRRVGLALLRIDFIGQAVRLAIQKS